MRQFNLEKIQPAKCIIHCEKIVSYLEDMTRISILKKSFLTHALMELVFKFKEFCKLKKKILEIGNRVLQQTDVKGLFIVHLKRLPLI